MSKKAYQTAYDYIVVFGSYETRGKAKQAALDVSFCDCFTDAQVYRVPYLDPFDCGSFEDDCSPDVIMACLRHGLTWNIDDCIAYNPDDYKTEADWQRVAHTLGATYPDYYNPKEQS